MTWRNTPDNFGLVTRLLHWLMAIGILFLLALGTRLAGMQPGLANLWLYGLHKSIGLCLLALVVIRLVWHRISPPPSPIGDPRALSQRLARWGHALIYILLLAIPLSGWIASSASGIDTVLFETWTVPRIAPVSAAWENAGWAAHGLLTKLLMAVLLVHVAAALKRQMDGDGTLRRMWSGGN
ncbi:cytochrome b [Tabrizicola sp. J26]|uniref:cytochrome b n=1 Tax=Alitabrizicola rongguiensis TaxID=2909234 RepID=UPI001F2A949C|nr:cytochrome b [Tabrizicola rongguiensis]MCF1708847.1 cytochrome b [Tabrizicola rongguiensis]